MTIVFFGTPDYVLPLVGSIHKNLRVKKFESPLVAVVTQPPKPEGRKKYLRYSGVDTWAHKKDLPVFYSSADFLKEGIKADLGILASYGAILPVEIINFFPQGIINIHPSLLPKFRGASPVQGAIAGGENETGVTFMKLDEKLDHGPIISQFREEILPEDTTFSLRNRLFARSAEVLPGLIDAYLNNKIREKEQDHKNATFTKEIKKEDAFINPKYMEVTLQGLSFKGNWEIPFIKDFTIHPTPSTIHQFTRAMYQWPIAWTKVNLGGATKRLQIIRAHIEDEKLVPEVVQLEGKGEVSWKQFKEGYPEHSFK